MNDITDSQSIHGVQLAFRNLEGEKPFKIDEAYLSHSRLLPNATLSPWLNDIEFMDCFEKIKKNTLVDIYRCYELWDMAHQLRDVPGDVLEVGVWRGGTGAVLSMAITTMPEKKIYLADTFNGVVKAGKNDALYQGGEHADTSVAIVRELLSSVTSKNAEILVGVFPDETGLLGPEKISLLHCDVDVYESSRDIFDWAFPRISVGGVVIFDDFGFLGCNGVTKLCNEIRNLNCFRFIYNLNGHAVLVRIK